MARLKLDSNPIAEFDTFREYMKSSENLQHTRFAYEKTLITSTDNFEVLGFCYVCQELVGFEVDFLHSGDQTGVAEPIPNWRERLLCPTCQLNNRVRACIHFLSENLGCRDDASIYITEQVTPLFRYLSDNFRDTIGSEYLGESVPFGSINEHGIRNESITRLSFANDMFDYILSFDVFEHVPEYSKALKECFRCLKPGGTLLFTVPFDKGIEDNRIRARIDEHGEIEHLLEPEYHGDPVSQEGCLCFYHFGWNLLEELRQAGFVNVNAHLYWSEIYGYLGGDQIIFTASK